MALVKVHNDNIYPFSQTFKDEEINIPAKGFIKMSQADAVLFKGAYSPMRKNAMNQPDPKFFKMIRIEEIKDEPPVVERKKFICQLDGKEFDTEAELEKYIDENHLDKLADQEFAQKRKGKTKKS